MVGVDSDVTETVCAWLAYPRGVWPVIIKNKDPKTGMLTVEWPPGPEPNKANSSLGEFVVRPDELKKWGDVGTVILTKVARDAYNFLLKTHPTLVDVLPGQKRVRPPTSFLDIRPSNKKGRVKPSSAKPSPAKPSPAKKSKKVKKPSRFRPLILLAAATREPAIIG